MFCANIRTCVFRPQRALCAGERTEAANVSDSSKQRRDKRWAERYERSQAAFDARGRDSEQAGGWVEHVSGPDGVSYQFEVIPPGEPVGRDVSFYFRFALSVFLRGWFPRASNEDWVVEVRPDRGAKTVSRKRFATYLAAREYMGQARLAVQTGSGPPGDRASS